MKRIFPALRLSLLAAAISLAGSANAGFVTLYDQDFETPNTPPGFSNGYGSGYRDVSQQQVNDLYGNQPAGFAFAQAYTVETVLLRGTRAFGTGYSDPTGKGGNYAAGMLSTTQSDLLGLSFNVGAYGFFNFAIDVSSLGLDGIGGPFANDHTAPRFRFTLYDNPTGAPNTGSGAILGQGELLGTSSAINTLDWTHGVFSFDTSGATNGNVTLQLDLLEGGYAVFDNFLITASDEAGGGIPAVPVPAALWLFGSGLLGLFGASSIRKAKSA